jgi:hypothetical protein
MQLWQRHVSYWICPRACRPRNTCPANKTCRASGAFGVMTPDRWHLVRTCQRLIRQPLLQANRMKAWHGACKSSTMQKLLCTCWRTPALHLSRRGLRCPRVLLFHQLEGHLFPARFALRPRDRQARQPPCRTTPQVGLSSGSILL